MNYLKLKFEENYTYVDSERTLAYSRKIHKAFNIELGRYKYFAIIAPQV